MVPTHLGERPVRRRGVRAVPGPGEGRGDLFGPIFPWCMWGAPSLSAHVWPDPTLSQGHMMGIHLPFHPHDGDTEASCPGAAWGFGSRFESRLSKLMLLCYIIFNIWNYFVLHESPPQSPQSPQASGTTPSKLAPPILPVLTA